MNMQFGFLAFVLVLPFFFVQPSQSYFVRFLMLLMVLLSHPIPLAFVGFGLYKIGTPWIIRILISSHNWDSLFYPFIVMVYLPLLVISIKVVCSRKD